MLTLLCVTLGLGTASLLITRIVNGTLRAASTAYWAGWTLLTASATYIEWRGLAPPTESEAIALMMEAQAAAFIAFAIGSFLNSRFRKPPVDNLIRGLQESEDLIRRYSRTWLSLITIIGAGFLAQKVISGGLSSTALMGDLRASYLNEGLPLIGKIYSYASTSIPILCVLLARSDRLYGVRMRRLGILVGCTGLGGFAMGGRGFLVAPFLAYAVAYLMVPAVHKLKSSQRRARNYKVAAYLLCAMSLFVVLGDWRFGRDQVLEGESSTYLKWIDTPAAWIATSTRGIMPYVETIGEMHGHGRAFFEWPAMQLERLGVLGTDTRKELDETRAVVYASYGDAGNFPPTIIPFMIGDWGSRWWIVAYIVTCLLGQFVTLRWGVLELHSHVFSALCMLAMFYMIQGALFFHPGNCLALLWLGALGYLTFIERHRHRRSISPSAPPLNAVMYRPAAVPATAGSESQ
jgi:hypothetical protein